jgi:membrane protease subunit (stomatin/prohibitin family)
VRVNNAQLFVNKIVGTQNVYTSEALQDFFRNMIIARLNSLLGETVKSLLDLPRQYDALSAAAKSRIKDDFGQYGVEIVDFLINAITAPEDVQKAIDERTGMGVIGNMNQYMQFKAARAVEDAAQNQGGAAGATAGLGIGAGLGFAMPGMINQAMQANAAQAAAPSAGAAATAACPKCGAKNAPAAKFCNDCGAPMTQTVSCPNCKTQNPAGAKFCGDCGTKLGA